ncbi:uncharacterized protein [Parasteatoda tepidariorum]|uniref:uncharacterized protein n=1 Tax=Parasteatoda tepidariorum TaxID=114398 RepID=UPI0039BC8631
MIRFAMNSAKCETTGETASFLMFGREMRTIDDVTSDFRAIVNNDNFVPEITPYLKRLANISNDIRDRVESKQDQRKTHADQKRQKSPQYAPGDKVWITLHPKSNAAKSKSVKFMPKREGPYIILTQRSPTSYEVAHVDKPNEPLGQYHVSALKKCSDENAVPVAPLRKRGRPKTLEPDPKTLMTLRRNKRPKSAGPSTRRLIGTRGVV